MSSTQKSSFGSAKRVLATVASAAMLFALLPAGVALGESPSDVCPPPDGAETFPDVDTGVHADNIECAAGYDIVQGYPDGEYKPGLDVFRAQMATFIVNLIEAARGEAMPAGTDAFDDDNDSVHEANINKLAEAGIVQGQAGDYNPARKVNRAAMATFIANAIDYVDDQDPDNNSVLPAAAADHFTDDDDSVHEENINRLADAGIVEGQDSATSYNPANFVFRGQMASFVIESASVLESEGLWAANDPEITTNQSFDVTSAEEAANNVSTSVADNTGRRSYAVSGLDTSKAYDIALFPAENVNVDADGVVTFDANTTIVDNTGPSIEIVNGAAKSAAGSADETEQVNNVTPQSDGTITFSIDSDAADEVVPVIWLDAESTGDNTLDHTDGTPTEAFGIGGQKNWVPAEALATDTGGTVSSANQNLDYFIAGGDTYYYDSNDLYRIQGGANLSMAQFEALLTGTDDGAADVISVTYDPDAADTSVFEVTDDNVPAPTNLKSTMSDLDSDGTSDDATLTWSAVAQGDAVYNVYVDDGDNTFDSGDTAVAENLTGTSTTINNAAGKTYHVGAEGSVSGQVSTGDPSVSPSTPVDATPSLVADGAAVEVNDADANAESGDVWNLFFSEAVSVTSDATIALASGDVVERGVNSTWTVDGTFVQVTLTANLAATTYPATISTLAGVTDADEGGKTATVTDNTLEDNGPEVYSDTADDTETTFTVTFNEVVLEASAENPDNYEVTQGDGTTNVQFTSAVLSADGRTVTLTAASALDEGPLAVTLDVSPATTNGTGVLDTDAQISGQTAYILVPDATAPVVQSAGFTDGAADGAFGTDATDQIVLVFNETMAAVDNTDSITAGGNTYVCDGTDITCTLSTTTVTNDTLTIVSAVPANVADLAGAVGKDVTGTSGVTDLGGNESTGYPETIA